MTARDSRAVHVLVVCTGNICRSPMAHWMLESFLADRSCGGVTVESAGTWGMIGHPATSEAIDVLARRGVDLSRHRSRGVDPRAVGAADLVVAMTSVHVRELSGLDESVGDKLRLLKELPELASWARHNRTVTDSRSGLEALLAAPRPEPRRALDVDDPIGLPISAYERCAGEIEVGIRALADTLCPG